MNQKERITDSINNHEYRELQAELDKAKDAHEVLQMTVDIFCIERDMYKAKLDKANEENKRLREELKRKEIAHHHY